MQEIYSQYPDRTVRVPVELQVQVQPRASVGGVGLLACVAPTRMATSKLCAAATNVTLYDDARTECKSLFYHDSDAIAMLIVKPKARRCGDGCFVHPQCGREKKQSCKRCPYPISCRNRTRSEIERDQHSIKSRLRTSMWTERLATCAVVGSAASLLAHNIGPEIDRATAVIRVNTGPVHGFEDHVGRRTDVRIWGSPMAPRDVDRIAAIVPQDPSRVNTLKHLAGLIKSETVVRYCGPNPWLASCWKGIAHDGYADPRFHPSAFRLASSLIHTNRTRCRRMGCVPTSGALAVLWALERCEHTTVYGFGVNGEGGVRAAPSCRSGAVNPSDPAATTPAERRCWKSRAQTRRTLGSGRLSPSPHALARLSSMLCSALRKVLRVRKGGALLRRERTAQLDFA